ncbi:MAG: hypothetical protein ACRYE7_02355, partial [Janthinobacterium lividum]
MGASTAASVLTADSVGSIQADLEPLQEEPLESPTPSELGRAQVQREVETSFDTSPKLAAPERAPGRLTLEEGTILTQYSDQPEAEITNQVTMVQDEIERKQRERWRDLREPRVSTQDAQVGARDSTPVEVAPARHASSEVTRKMTQGPGAPVLNQPDGMSQERFGHPSAPRLNQVFDRAGKKTRIEIIDLHAMNASKFLPYDDWMKGRRIHESRIVVNVKGATTVAPPKKSRLIIQAFNDKGKSRVRTQSPTVQGASARLMSMIRPLHSVLEVKELNVALKSQTGQPDAGLTHVSLGLDHLSLYVFTDGSFADNSDFTFQIGYVIVLGNETPATFTLRGNVLHWSSTKCKRVTRTVLASELYAMVQGVGMAIPLASTINKIMERLELSPVPIVVCTDDFSLCECLVKLETTDEKHLMINIMSIGESYERKELTEIRWINGKENSADAMAEESRTGALRTLAYNNELQVREKDGWNGSDCWTEGEKRGFFVSLIFVFPFSVFSVYLFYTLLQSFKELSVGVMASSFSSVCRHFGCGPIDLYNRTPRIPFCERSRVHRAFQIRILREGSGQRTWPTEKVKRPSGMLCVQVDDTFYSGTKE